MTSLFFESVTENTAIAAGLLLVSGALAVACGDTGSAHGSSSNTTTTSSSGNGGNGGSTGTTTTGSGGDGGSGTTTTTTGTGGNGGAGGSGTTTTTGTGGSGGDGGSSTTTGTGGNGGAGGSGGSGGVACDPAMCDDADACTTDGCENGACAHVPVSIDDGDACTTDACDPATGVSHTPIVCNDGDVCTTDSCNPATGCTTVPTVYFSEPFANNNQGWALGTSWQIGPEIPNPIDPPAPLANPDPMMDHTPTDDNGVAGVYIGGNTTASAHAFYYLTSPAIDLAAVSTPVHLEFWRHLNSDDPVVMKSTVDVYDGAAWQPVYANKGAVMDSVWTKQQYDVSAFKNANFRVRWGWQANQGALICSQWNVDDVRLLPDPTCP